MSIWIAPRNWILGRVVSLTDKNGKVDRIVAYPCDFRGEFQSYDFVELKPETHRPFLVSERGLLFGRNDYLDLVVDLPQDKVLVVFIRSKRWPDQAHFWGTQAGYDEGKKIYLREYRGVEEAPEPRLVSMF